MELEIQFHVMHICCCFPSNDTDVIVISEDNRVSTMKTLNHLNGHRTHVPLLKIETSELWRSTCETMVPMILSTFSSIQTAGVYMAYINCSLLV